MRLLFMYSKKHAGNSYDVNFRHVYLKLFSLKLSAFFERICIFLII